MPGLAKSRGYNSLITYYVGVVTMNNKIKSELQTLAHYQQVLREAQQDVEERTLSLHLEPDLHLSLVAYAADCGITREQAIREILHHYL